MAVDAENAATILAYIKQDKRHTKKFQHIVDIILAGLRNTELYDKEEINDKVKGVTAMKLFKGQENDRIYCKEYTTDNGQRFVVVAAEFREKKKTQKNAHKETHLIETVATYEYEFTDE